MFIVSEYEEVERPRLPQLREIRRPKAHESHADHGWTGLISFIMNIGAVAQNWQHLHRLHRLPAASRPPGAPSAGRPVFLRPGILVAAIIAVAIGFLASHGDTGGWSLGSCAVVEGDRVKPTGCGLTHDARVYKVVGESESYPPPAMGSIIVASKRYCTRATPG